MNKTLICFMALLLVGAAVFSTETTISQYSYSYYPVYRVYQNGEGYIIVYDKDGINIGRAYVLKSWFRYPEHKGKFVPLAKGLTPYLIVYRKNGEFSHLVLGMPTKLSKGVMAIAPASLNTEGKFSQDKVSFE